MHATESTPFRLPYMASRSVAALASPAPTGRDPTPPIVFIVSDDECVRESVSALVRCSGWQPETFSSQPEFLACPRRWVPSCLVVDHSLPGLDGLALQQRVINERPEVPIIFMTGCVDMGMAVQAMKAGALEVLPKPPSDGVFVEAIRLALGHCDSKLDLERRVDSLRRRYESLSRREREVMAGVVGGLLNKQIGGELDISEITVKAHRGRVMRKMGAKSLPALVTMAALLGMGPQSA